MSDKTKPAGAAPRNEIPQEDFDALVARVTTAEASITSLTDRVTKLEEANANANDANAKLKASLESQSKELDAIKAKTLATPPAKPGASATGGDAPKTKDEQLEALSASLAKETNPEAKFKIAAEIKKLRRS